MRTPERTRPLHARRSQGNPLLLWVGVVVFVAVVVWVCYDAMAGALDVTVRDVQAIREETSSLERQFMAAWKAHGEAQKPNGRYPRDVWHHNKAIEGILSSVRSDCRRARDAILHGDQRKARRIVTAAKESLRKGWRHQALWKEGRAH